MREATSGLQAGDIILMHQGDLCSVEALPAIIARVRAMGLEPTTLARLADAGGIVSGDPVAMSAMVNAQLARSKGSRRLPAAGCLHGDADAPSPWRVAYAGAG